MKYLCSTSDHKRDEGSLLSGSTCKLTNISLAYLPEISFKIGQNQWSKARTIDALSTVPLRVVMLTQGSSRTVGAVLTMLVKTDSKTGTVEVCVYSTGMLCDRTGGLAISLWARRDRSETGEEMIRNTFQPSSSSGKGSSSIVRPYLSSADKSRRKATIKAALRSRIQKGAMSGLSPTDVIEEGDSQTLTIASRHGFDSSLKTGTGTKSDRDDGSQQGSISPKTRRKVRIAKQTEDTSTHSDSDVDSIDSDDLSVFSEGEREGEEESREGEERAPSQGPRRHLALQVM